jgi:hypothetical protein
MKVRLESRLRWYNAIRADPERYLRRLGPRYLFLPWGYTPPIDRTRWTVYQDGPFWTIWERKPRP